MLHFLIGLGLVVGGVAAVVAALFLLYQVSRIYDLLEIIGASIAIPSIVAILAIGLGEAVTGSHPSPPIWLMWVCGVGFATYVSAFPLCWYYYAFGGED